MRISYYILFFVGALDVMAWILMVMGVAPVMLTPINADLIDQNIDPNAIVEGFEQADTSFYDVQAGLNFFNNAYLPVIEDGLKVLLNAGVPWQLLVPITWLFRTVMVGFFISFISGRDFMP